MLEELEQALGERSRIRHSSRRRTEEARPSAPQHNRNSAIVIAVWERVRSRPLGCD
jgi:hypothetical protein